MRITDQWFDGDMPNPLHPIGWLIDPRTRTVSVPVYSEGRLTALIHEVLEVGDEIDADGNVTRAADEPKTMEVWRD